MRHTLLCLLTILSIAACNQASRQPDTSASAADSSITTAKSDSISQLPLHLTEGSIYVDSAMAVRLSWIDSVVPIALKASANPLIRDELKDSSITWMWDRLVFSDTATYIPVHVGHEENDERGFKRFVTAGWLYVDTLFREVYEYNVEANSLLKLPTTASQHIAQ